MNSDQLKQFEIIAKHENLRKASEELFISAPALSYTITNLETEFGCTLFNRVGGKLNLNENGKKLLKYAKKISFVINEIKDDFSINTLTKPITIEALTYVHFAYIFNGFLNQNSPNYMTIIGYGNQMLKDLISEKVQAVIDYDRPEYSSYEKYLKKYLIIKENYIASVPRNHLWYENSSLLINDINNKIFLSNQGHVPWMEEFMSHFKINLNLHIYDHITYTLMYKNENNLFPILHPLVPKAQALYDEYLASSQYHYIPIKECIPRPLYLWWLKDHDSYITPLINNLLETQKAFFKTIH